VLAHPHQPFDLFVKFKLIVRERKGLHHERFLKWLWETRPLKDGGGSEALQGILPSSAVLKDPDDHCRLPMSKWRSGKAYASMEGPQWTSVSVAKRAFVLMRRGARRSRHACDNRTEPLGRVSSSQCLLSWLLARGHDESSTDFLVHSIWHYLPT